MNSLEPSHSPAKALPSASDAPLGAEGFSARTDLVDQVLAGLQALRNDLAHRAEIAAKIAIEKADLERAKASALKWAATLSERRTEARELEKRIAEATAKLEELRSAIDDRSAYRHTLESEVTTLKQKLGLN